MFRKAVGGVRTVLCAVILFQTVGALSLARAEHRVRRSGRVVVERARPVFVPRPAAHPPGTLGTFYPTPYLTIGGNYPAGNAGYTPLGMFGSDTLSLYGPMSSLRATTAPVATYSRGYDGTVRVHEGVATSYPNLPLLSPVIYPTQANHYYAPRTLRTPWWDSAINWIDQN
jgi:hypothetical protein